jgi:hypothetical protein
VIRKVEHVMGMPISLALRGRHAGDARGDAAWAAALDVLRAADRTFSTYRADSVISRINRGDLADTRPRSPRCWPSAPRPSGRRAGRSRCAAAAGSTRPAS